VSTLMHGHVDAMAQSPMPRHRSRGARLSRIRDMSFAEVAYRGHQETAKLLERVSARGRYPDPAVWLQGRAPAIATASAALSTPLPRSIAKVTRPSSTSALGPVRSSAGITNGA